MGVNKLLFEKRSALQAVGKQINDLNAELESLDAFNTVLDFSCFSTVDRQFSQSWFATAKAEEIEKWLLGGTTEKERQSERRRARIEEMMKQIAKIEGDSDGDDLEEDDFMDLEEQQEQERRLDYDDLELDVGGPVKILNPLLKVSTLEEELKKKVLERNTLEVTDENVAELEELEEECFALQNKIVFIKVSEKNSRRTEKGSKLVKLSNLGFTWYFGNRASDILIIYY